MVKFSCKGKMLMKKIIDFFKKIFNKSELSGEEQQEVIEKIMKKIKEN